MNEFITQIEQAALKEQVRSHFDDWCERNKFQIPESPTELLNQEKLNAAQIDYVWSVIGFLH